MRPPLCYLNIFIRYLVEVLFISNTYDPTRQDTINNIFKTLNVTIKAINDEDNLLKYMNLLFKLIKALDQGKSKKDDFLAKFEEEILDLRKICLKSGNLNQVYTQETLVNAVDEYCFLPIFPSKKPKSESNTDPYYNTGVTTYFSDYQKGFPVSYGYLFCLYVALSSKYLMLESVKEKLLHFNCPLYKPLM